MVGFCLPDLVPSLQSVERLVAALLWNMSWQLRAQTQVKSAVFKWNIPPLHGADPLKCLSALFVNYMSRTLRSCSGAELRVENPSCVVKCSGLKNGLFHFLIPVEDALPQTAQKTFCVLFFLRTSRTCDTINVYFSLKL